jgi:hypothetical protein
MPSFSEKERALAIISLGAISPEFIRGERTLWLRNKDSLTMASSYIPNS